MVVRPRRWCRWPVSDGRTVDAPRLVDVKAHHMAEAFTPARRKTGKRFDKREGEWAQHRLPAQDRGDLPCARGPVATAGADPESSNCPTLRADGSILDLPGL